MTINADTIKKLDKISRLLSSEDNELIRNLKLKGYKNNFLYRLNC